MKTIAKLIWAFMLFGIGKDLEAQDLIRLNNTIAIDSGITNGSSTAISHINKVGMNYNLEEFNCGLLYLSGYYQIFTVSQQSDLIYYEAYFDSTYTSLKIQGYFRLFYINSEIGYCWNKDLIWNEFDIEGKLTSINYFEKGIIKPSPYVYAPGN